MYEWKEKTDFNYRIIKMKPRQFGNLRKFNNHTSSATNDIHILPYISVLSHQGRMYTPYV